MAKFWMKAMNVVLSLGQKPEITAGNKSTYNKKISGFQMLLVFLESYLNRWFPSLHLYCSRYLCACKTGRDELKQIFSRLNFIFLIPFHVFDVNCGKTVFGEKKFK